jgi:hypothetical protein
MTDLQKERAATEAAEKAFREFVRSKSYPAWAREQRLAWEAGSEHARAWRERQRKEGSK